MIYFRILKDHDSYEDTWYQKCVWVSVWVCECVCVCVSVCCFRFHIVADQWSLVGGSQNRVSLMMMMMKHRQETYKNDVTNSQDFYAKKFLKS